ncbi:MAG: hypothetical protein Q8R92_03835 [Deltaproteobacteria bacterium]|nr:hypothetical protein [Deltaproteobacteria bacterium]
MFPNGGQAQDLAYSYDPSGNIASVTDALDPNGSRSFTYDGLDRLTAATGPSTSDTYAYSPSGNLLSKEGQPQLYTIPAHPHAVSEAIGLSMSYDAAGNLTGAGDNAYSYDEEGRMSEARQGGVLNLSDNCPDVTNPAPTDTDAGNLGDACDAVPFNPDQDGDGLLDGDEVRTYHTDPANADTDGDGASDGVEVAQGFDPLDPASTPPLGGAVPALSAARGDRPGMLSRGSRRPA